jgi:peroxiredoxin
MPMADIPSLLKRILPGPVTLILVVAIVWFWFRPPAWVSDMNQPAPEFQVATFDGEHIRMAQLRGRVVLVNFWASWCPYCRHEMPAMQEFFDDYSGRGFTILALSTDDDMAAAETYLRENPHTFPAAMSYPMLAGAFGGVNRLPTSFVIDKKGVIRHKISGQVHYARLQKLVEPLLEE